MSQWNPMKPIYDLIQVLKDLKEAIDWLAAELRALRYSDLEKVVDVLKKPTNDVQDELNHQKGTENNVTNSSSGY